MKYRFPAIILCLAIFTLSCCLFNIRAVEADLQPLEVYVQHGSSGTPELIKTYTQSDMEAMANMTQYYTGIDSMPCVVQGKGTGVLLMDLVADLSAFDANITFVDSDNMQLDATDGYSMTYTYSYLLGSPRYYYPNYLDLKKPDLSNPQIVEPMLAVVSWQGRTTSSNPVTRQVLDTKKMINSDSYRLCFGLLPSDASNKNITANKLCKWAEKITFILSGDTSSGQGWDLNSDHKCDMGDITMIGQKWQQTGAAGWIPEDVNKDGVINIGDVILLGMHWGQTW